MRVLTPMRVICAAVALGSWTASDAGEVQFRGSYAFDALVTSNWESELSYTHAVVPALKLRATVQYLDATQDSLSGIRRLRAQALSALGGLSLTTLRHHAVLDLGGGADWIIEGATRPRIEAKASIGIPVPENRVVQSPRFVLESWYRHRIANAPAVKNEIASYGLSGDLTANLTSRAGLGANLRREYLRPQHALLDTAYKSPVRGGIPPDTLDNNAITSFYAYAYLSVVKHFNLGYAFSCGNSEIDRWVATRSEPQFSTGFPPRITGTDYWYAYYPYATLRHTLAHSLVISGDIPAGTVLLVEAKAVIPLYSRREAYSSPATIPAGGTGRDASYSYYYTQKFTGPLSLNAKARVRVREMLTIGVAYEYFCMPYREWAYFTDDSYSYHKVSMTVGVVF